jgi:hypothetical protein
MVIFLQVKLAVDHFNKDHKKGLQYLQAQRLMPLLAGSPAAEAALASSSNPAMTARCDYWLLQGEWANGP